MTAPRRKTVTMAMLKKAAPGGWVAHEQGVWTLIYNAGNSIVVDIRHEDRQVRRRAVLAALKELSR